MKTLLLLIYCLLMLQVNAQISEVYIPPKMKKIYGGPTRSYNGKPGKEYWQNRADYDISVELNTEEKELIGFETIEFYNNSPDTLRMLFIKLFQDLYRKGTMIDFPIGPADLHDGTIINSVKINGDEIDLSNSANRRTTNLIITNLPENIAPNSVTEIEIDWKFKIPNTAQVRMGVYRNNAYFLAYFFPRIAVYDDIHGWDRSTYSGKVEFYNDFGNYNVEITVPQGFVVRATGENTNAEEMLQPKIFERYREAQESDDVINIITPKDLESLNITAKNKKNTWKFYAVNVPDFSFCATEDYLWDGVSVIVNKNEARRVFTDVLYYEGAKFFDQAAQISKETIEYMSYEMPGVPFPYPHMTTFCNGSRGGGMESPMMANNGVYSSFEGFYTLFHHENGHTYFPFYTGINETLYSWMDESWATYLPVKLIEQKVENHNRFDYLWRRYIKPYAGSFFDIPLMIPSNNTSGLPLIAKMYGRGYLGLFALESALGIDKFKECTIEFISRWKGKHPTPYDFFYTYNDVAGEDLAWIWNPWYFEIGHADLALEKKENENILVKNLGVYPVPFSLKIIFEDNSEEIINESIRIWKDGNTEFEIKHGTDKKIKRAELLDEFYPDIVEENNVINF